MRQCTPKGMAPKADTILDRIEEFEENACMALLMIHVRSSLDSRAPVSV